MTLNEEMKEALRLKDLGNEAYKTPNYSKSLSYYNQALSLARTLPNNEALCGLLYKNRAAVEIKLENWSSVLENCSRSLEFLPSDPKGLYRRSLAHEALGNIEAAYKDAKDLQLIDKNNKELQPLLLRLHGAISQKVNESSRTCNKVKAMFDIVFDGLEVSVDKRETAADNLIVLAREKAGASLLVSQGVFHKIIRLMKVEKNKRIRLSLVRTINELCKESAERSKDLLKISGIPFFLDILNQEEEEAVNAASSTIQILLDSISSSWISKACEEKKKKNKDLSGEDRKEIRREEERRKAIIQENSKELESIRHVVCYNVTSRTLSGLARDALIEIIMKNVKWNELSWAEKALETDTYSRLLEVASEMMEYKHESAMNITNSTRNTVGVCIGLMYDQMYDDVRRNLFLSKIDDFVKEKLMNPSMEAKVRVIVAITTLLNNAHELGQTQISKEGILQMMLVMGQSESHLEQLVATEALIASASKKKDSNFIISSGIDILKGLYRSQVPSIKVRALVGLCKLGASSGHDASLRPFSDGSSVKLAEACRRFLISVSGKKDTEESMRDLRKWATEGLSYLTLDADVKEKLIEDEPALRALLTLAKDGKADVAYGVLTVLVHLTNSFDKVNLNPELLELAKFAKHHVPTEHELDDEDFVDKRIFTLSSLGVVTSLVCLSKNESHYIKELIARVCNSLCKHESLRGLVVQQGGSGVLTSLALEGTEKGKLHAAQALSRIAISISPSIAFPGQRSTNVIRPIVSLLSDEYEALVNFEALLALCNLSSLNEETRSRILNESGFIVSIENYMYESHVLLRRAAVQCWNNLCLSPLMTKRCEGQNDRVKYMVLLCGDAEDNEVVKAASGALATLTFKSHIICHKVFDSIQWSDCLLNVLANTDFEIVLRGVTLVRNIMMTKNVKDGERIVESQIMDVLQAHIFKANLDSGSYEPNPTLQTIKEISEETLKVAHEMKLVKTSKEAENDPDSD